MQRLAPRLISIAPAVPPPSAWRQCLAPRLISIASAVPHPSAFAKNFTLGQALRSSYMALLVPPLIPEVFLSTKDWRITDGLSMESPVGLVNKHMLAEEDRERFKAAASQPGAITGGLNYYRAMMAEIALGGLGVRLDEPPMKKKVCGKGRHGVDRRWSRASADPRRSLGRGR